MEQEELLPSIVKTQDILQEKLDKERRLQELSKQLKKGENNCNHIIIFLGRNRYYKEQYKCLLCGCSYFTNPKIDIDCEHYLTNYDLTDNDQLYLKYNCIQTLCMGLLKSNTSQSREDLINNFNNMVTNEDNYTLKRKK